MNKLTNLARRLAFWTTTATFAMTADGCFETFRTAFQTGYDAGSAFADSYYGDPNSGAGGYGGGYYDDSEPFYSNWATGTTISGDLNNGGYINFGDGSFYP